MEQLGLYAAVPLGSVDEHSGARSFWVATTPEGVEAIAKTMKAGLGPNATPKARLAFANCIRSSLWSRIPHSDSPSPCDHSWITKIVAGRITPYQAQKYLWDRLDEYKKSTNKH
jgi:hypothetical protein